MTTRGSVLISGAGIAGPALAYWLHRYGFAVTVLERADALRISGQNIDVRGAGREVTRRMGIEQKIAESGTGEVGTRFVDQHGHAIAKFPAGTGDSDGATAELEILRGQLAELLVGLTAGLADVTYVYGDQITAIEQDDATQDHGALDPAALDHAALKDAQLDDAGVHVSFTHAQRQRFDLVVIAEGVRSRTRRLVFGDEPALRDLGQYTAYGSIPQTEDDDRWWRWHSAVPGRAVMLRPDNVGTTRASLSFLSPASGLEDLEPDEQLKVFRERFADVHWQAPRILDALSADRSDFYVDRVAQVHAPSWSRGRVVLVGDAGYCPSPISGMGTSLALTGAYVLAGELARDPDHRAASSVPVPRYSAALRSYERLLRPYVDKAQKLPPGAPRVANPMTRLGLAAFNTGLRLAASRPARSLAGRLMTPPADDFTLPDYSALVS